MDFNPTRDLVSFIADSFEVIGGDVAGVHLLKKAVDLANSELSYLLLKKSRMVNFFYH